jgi:hypothetical protein
MKEPSKQPVRPTMISADGVRVGESIAGPLDLPLAKAAVTQCRVDRGFTLVLDELDAVGRVWTVRIDGPFRLADADKHRTAFDDDARPSAWGPAIDAVLDATLIDAIVAADGGLSLRFDTGHQLGVPPQRAYEAWQVTGPDGFLAVCEPGGGVSRWPVQLT